MFPAMVNRYLPPRACYVARCGKCFNRSERLDGWPVVAGHRITTAGNQGAWHEASFVHAAVIQS
jgi:hypothetical protein